MAGWRFHQGDIKFDQYSPICVLICTLEVFPFAAGEGSGDVFGELGALGPHLIVGPQLCGV